jgi:hypothetical protein
VRSDISSLAAAARTAASSSSVKVMFNEGIRTMVPDKVLRQVLQLGEAACR